MLYFLKDTRYKKHVTLKGGWYGSKYAENLMNMGPQMEGFGDKEYFFKHFLAYPFVLKNLHFLIVVDGCSVKHTVYSCHSVVGTQFYEFSLRLFTLQLN